MFTASNIIALISALPAILKLFQSFVNYAERQEGRKLGRAEAFVEAAGLSMKAVDEAALARVEAEKDHAAHPNDDGGFDSEFMRKP